MKVTSRRAAKSSKSDLHPLPRHSHQIPLTHNRLPGKLNILKLDALKVRVSSVGAIPESPLPSLFPRDKDPSRALNRPVSMCGERIPYSSVFFWVVSYLGLKISVHPFQRIFRLPAPLFLHPAITVRKYFLVSSLWFRVLGVSNYKLQIINLDELVKSRHSGGNRSPENS